MVAAVNNPLTPSDVINNIVQSYSDTVPGVLGLAHPNCPEVAWESQWSVGNPAAWANKDLRDKINETTYRYKYDVCVEHAGKFCEFVLNNFDQFLGGPRGAKVRRLTVVSAIAGAFRQKGRQADDLGQLVQAALNDVEQSGPDGSRVFCHGVRTMAGHIEEKSGGGANASFALYLKFLVPASKNIESVLSRPDRSWKGLWNRGLLANGED